MENSDGSISLRPVIADDEQFLREVFRSCRGDDLRELGWDEDRVREFLDLQYDAQRRLYESEYPRADDQVVLCKGNAAGRLIVDRRDHEIRCVDIALLPAHQSAGIGAFLMRGLQDEAKLANKPLRLRVIRFSRALSLFERLGFVRNSETGTHFQLEWLPGS